MTIKITPQQCLAGRALLGFNRNDAAEGMGLSPQALSQFETKTSADTRISTYEKMYRFFDNHGLRFTESGGVEPHPNNTIRTLEGKNAMEDFLDDVYSTAVKYGTKKEPTQVFLSNVDHTNWARWMSPERWDNHRQRMTEDRDLMDVRIITQEGDPNFLTLKYSKYKWIKEQYFNDKSFYSYHDRLAFLDFREDGITINIMIQPEFARGYRDMFLMVWDDLAIDPPKELIEESLSKE